MKRALQLATVLWLYLIGGASAVNWNPVVGSVWTWLGPTFGADWTQLQLQTPQPYGCAGNGVADDTGCLQAAIDAVGASGGGVLYFDATHKYKITAGLTSNRPVNIVGPYPGGLPVYSSSCPSGIIVNSDITAFTLTAVTGSVQGMCFEMATTAGRRRSGAAIKAGTMVGLTPVQGQGHALIQGNTIIFPYDGILIGGNTTGSGSPGQTNGNVVRDNVIRSASHIAIANGKDSTGQSTVGTKFDNNQIACFEAATTAVGLAIYDGAPDADMGDGGPYNCDVGTLLYPGINQFVYAKLSGVLGDTVGHYGLLIDSAGGQVDYVRATNWWTATSTNTKAGGAGVMIRNTSGSAYKIRKVQLVGGASSLGGNPANEIHAIHLSNDVYGINIVGNTIDVSGSSTNGKGVVSASSGWSGMTLLQIVGNDFTIRTAGDGCFAQGVHVTGTGDVITITNNNFSTGVCSVGGDFGVNETIVWATTPTTRAVIANNQLLVESEPTVASAAGITAPMVATFEVSGVVPISTMGGMWGGRQARIIPQAAVPFVTGGGTGKFCTALTATPGVPILASWHVGDACWRLK